MDPVTKWQSMAGMLVYLENKNFYLKSKPTSVSPRTSASKTLGAAGEGLRDRAPSPSELPMAPFIHHGSIPVFHESTEVLSLDSVFHMLWNTLNFGSRF